MDDQNRTFRTRLVAFWMLSNATLAVAIENLNGLPSKDEAKDEAELQHKQNIYFSIILYSTFALAAVRFTGVSVAFLPMPRAAADTRTLAVSVLLPETQPFQVLPPQLDMFHP